LIVLVFLLILIGVINNRSNRSHISRESQQTAIIGSKVVETHPKRGVVCFVYVSKEGNAISCLRDFTAVEK
jgi:hypothetical protein